MKDIVMDEAQSYSVYFNISGVDILDGRYSDRNKAIVRANYLFNTQKYLFVKITQSTGGVKAVVFEKRCGGSSKSSVLKNVVNSYFCSGYLDAYCFDARSTISQMMRNYLDENFAIPSELLHNYSLLKAISFDRKIVDDAATKLAQSQTSKAGGDPIARKSNLVTIFRDVMAASEKSSQLELFYQKFIQFDLSRLIEEVISEQPGETHDRIITYVISREIKGIRDWDQKVIRLCKIHKNSQSCLASQVLDEFIAETIASPVAIKSVIGLSSDLSFSLKALALAYHGLLTDSHSSTVALRMLSDFNRDCKPLLTRAAIASIIANSLKGNSLLTKQGRAEDRISFQSITTTLQNQQTFVGDSEMSRALTLRAKSLFGTSHLNLPLDAAIHIVCEMLTCNEQRFDYIIGLLLSDLGGKNTTIIVEKIIELLGNLTSDEIASLSSRMLYDEGSQQYIEGKFLASGLPINIINEIFAYLSGSNVRPDCNVNIFRKFDNFSNSRSIINVVPGNSTIETTKQAKADCGSCEDMTTVLSQNESNKTKINNFDAASCHKILKVVLADTGDNWAIYSVGKKLIVGRSEACDISINDNIVSRIHGYFLCTESCFAYFDQSSNGSFLIQDGKVIKLNKSNIILEGNGSISIALDPTTQSHDKRFVLTFEIY